MGLIGNDKVQVPIAISKEILRKAKLYGTDMEEAIAGSIIQFEEHTKQPLLNVSVLLGGPENHDGGVINYNGFKLEAYSKNYVKATPHSLSGNKPSWVTTESLREFAENIMKICDSFEQLKMNETIEGIVTWDKPKNDP